MMRAVHACLHRVLSARRLSLILLSGPASCLLWVNRKPVGRLHTFLGPQTSLYVPDGFWEADNEVLVMMCVAAVTCQYRVCSLSLAASDDVCRYTCQATPATIQVTCTLLCAVAVGAAMQVCFSRQFTLYPPRSVCTRTSAATSASAATATCLPPQLRTPAQPRPSAAGP